MASRLRLNTEGRCGGEGRDIRRRMLPCIVAVSLVALLAACVPGAGRGEPEPTFGGDDSGTSADTPDTADTADTPDTADTRPDPSTCAPATPEDIRDRQGDYYRCLDTTLIGGVGCGAEGYPLGFGAKYADRSFEETWYELTPAGQAFFLAVSPCLQERLAAQMAADTSCDEVWDDGFATHAGCYVDSGFCELPAEDLLVIGWMFDADVYLLDEFASQLADVAAGCAA